MIWRMMILNKIYTIGFTKKNAEEFFTLLQKNKVQLLVDVRLNNSSQLAGFSKFPDIEFFLKKICGIEYKHEILFAPEENTLKRYKKKEIDWDQYVLEFNETMKKRNIREYIAKAYKNVSDDICLLCSEPTPEQCHRRLIAEIFSEVFPEIKIIHI